MELKGTQQIRSPRPDVWTALNDPDVLQQCIPGCGSLAKDCDDAYRIVIMATAGPVKAKFNGRLVLSDIREDEGIRVPTNALLVVVAVVSFLLGRMA